MMYFYQVLLVIHVGAAVTMHAFATGHPRRLKEAFGSGAERLRSTIAHIERDTKFIIGGSMLALATGITLILLSGGFAAVHVRFHISLLLLIVMSVLGGAVVGPAVSKLKTIASQGNSPLGGDAGDLLKRIVNVYAVQNVLWCTILVLMLWKLV